MHQGMHVKEIAEMNYTSSYCTSTWYKTQDKCGLSILFIWIMRSRVPQTVPKKIIVFCGGLWNFKILFYLEWKSTVLKFCRGTGTEKLCIVIARVSMTTGKYSEPQSSGKVLNISKQPWQFYMTCTRNANKDKSLVILPQRNRLRTTYLCFYVKVNKSQAKTHCLVSAEILHEASHVPVNKDTPLCSKDAKATKVPVNSH